MPETINDLIDDFSGEYEFLSNLYMEPIYYHFYGWFKSAEHIYQYEKARNEEDKRRIREAETSLEARNIGEKVPIRKDWFTVRFGIMKDILWCKFAYNERLRNLLLNTGEAEILNITENDTFWGVIKDENGNYNGCNFLGKLLMKIREELKSSSFASFPSI